MQAERQPPDINKVLARASSEIGKASIQIMVLEAQLEESEGRCAEKDKMIASLQEELVAKSGGAPPVADAPPEE